MLDDFFDKGVATIVLDSEFLEAELGIVWMGWFLHLVSWWRSVFLFDVLYGLAGCDLGDKGSVTRMYWPSISCETRIPVIRTLALPLFWVSVKSCWRSSVTVRIFADWKDLFLDGRRSAIDIFVVSIVAFLWMYELWLNSTLSTQHFL